MKRLEWKLTHGSYLVGSNGTVFSLKSQKILKTNINVFGYHKVKLYMLSIPYDFYVHRLVASTFIPISNPTEMEVHHKNKNKNDNSLENLCWVTPQEHREYEEKNT